MRNQEINAPKIGTSKKKSPAISIYETKAALKKRRTRREIIEANLRAIKNTRMAFG